MRCDYCNREFINEEDIVCEKGYLHHKDCAFNSYVRRNLKLKKVYILYGVERRDDPNNIYHLNLPWTYGVYEDEEKADYIKECMENSEEYGYLYWTIVIKYVRE